MTRIYRHRNKFTKQSKQEAMRAIWAARDAMMLRRPAREPIVKREDYCGYIVLSLYGTRVKADLLRARNCRQHKVFINGEFFAETGVESAWREVSRRVPRMLGERNCE